MWDPVNPIIPPDINVTIRGSALCPPSIRRRVPSASHIDKILRDLKKMNTGDQLSRLLELLFYWPALTAELIFAMDLEKRKAKKLARKKEQERRQVIKKMEREQRKIINKKEQEEAKKMQQEKRKVIKKRAAEFLKDTKKREKEFNKLAMQKTLATDMEVPSEPNVGENEERNTGRCDVQGMTQDGEVFN